MESKGEIVIYQNSEKGFDIQVRLENETLWLSQKAMSELFEKDSDTIGLHIKNIYKERELSKDSTTEFFSVVQKEGGRNVKRKIIFYNLDVILSVGYRVSSKKGTQFRIWATQRLKEHLVNGYTINESRLRLLSKNLEDLKGAVELIENSQQQKNLNLSEATGLLNILTDYTRSLVLLSKYDNQSLEQDAVTRKITYEISYADAYEAIVKLKETLKKKKEATGLFGNQKDESFKGILGNIVQTFAGKYLYASIGRSLALFYYQESSFH